MAEGHSASEHKTPLFERADMLCPLPETTLMTKVSR